MSHITTVHPIHRAPDIYLDLDPQFLADMYISPVGGRQTRPALSRHDAGTAVRSSMSIQMALVIQSSSMSWVGLGLSIIAPIGMAHM